MRYTIFILSLLFPFLSIVAQPKHEVRAAWVTAVYGLDWPRTRATTPQTIRKQKEELIDILDKLKAANFNTVLFQTRTRGDVLYPSAIEPFNSILTGKQEEIQDMIHWLLPLKNVISEGWNVMPGW